MDTMNISLPEPLKEFVDTQIASGRYSSVSEYIRTLIRDDEKRRAEERLEELLMEGLASGEDIPLNKKFWKEVRGEAAQIMKKHKTRNRP